MAYQKKIIKVCKKHGPLTRKETRIQKTKGRANLRVCLTCEHEKSKRYYEKSKRKDKDIQRKTIDRKQLKDSYLRELLVRYSPLSAKDIPQWMVEVKRASLTINRNIAATKEG